MRARPLRILYVTNHRRFKIYFRAYPWARELAARGHEVDVFCHADINRFRTIVEHVDGFRIVHTPDLLIGAARQGWDPVCALRRYAFLAREGREYDLIHCLDTRPAVIWPALAYARQHQIPIVSDWIDWWGRGGLISERRPWWYQIALGGLETWFEEHYRNKLDGLTTISHALLERGVDLGVSRERCFWIPGGANLDDFSTLPSKVEARGRLGIPPDAPVLCFSGLDVLIDLPLAVQAFEHLLSRFPDARLLLVGPTIDQASSALSNTGNRSRIVATGPVPYLSLMSYLAAADVFLMPYANKISNVGRWPNKAGDYMCAGRPVISNPVGEAKWLYEHYPIGLLTDPTPEAMSRAAETLLLEPERARQLGENARTAAEDVFSWSRLVTGLEDWYHRIVSQTRGASRA